MSTARERLALEFPDESPDNEELWEFEIFWRDHYDWLKNRGYLLRPRYRPGWVASWIGTTKEAFRCEDNQVQPLVSLSFPLNLDAIRVADGRPVMLRRADPPSISDELEIGRLVSSKEFRSDAQNHCVPIYESLELPKANEVGRKCIVVMPFLVPWDEVGFVTVGEVVDFCDQVFEGLQFMHKMSVAHNDAKTTNIMMEWSPLYRNPPHAMDSSMRMDWEGPSKPRNRTLCPVKYHLIDWDLSKRYDTIRGVTLRMPGYGGDQSVPEFRRKEPCNPFSVDVYCLGNVIRQKFIEVHSIRNLEFLQELVFDMTHDDPQKRPTMDEVVARFGKIRKGLSWWKLRSRAGLGSKHGFHCSSSISIIILNNTSVVNARGVIESLKLETKVAQSGMYKIEERSWWTSNQSRQLWDFEIFWRDHYDWLKDRGYLLRPRYRPGWVASWIGTTREAPRRADPPSISDELEIGRLLSSKESLSDHRNHCVPIYESIELPNANEEGRRCIVVMPLLVPWEEVEFKTVGEVVDFCGQVFEGLQFMHKMNVAHNDAKANNIMMDWSPLYPTPPHALKTSMRMDWKGPSKPRNRTLCPIKYHFIDWDLSKQYDIRGVTLRMPGYGGDQSVPEFRRKEPCNPFAVDVYCLGNVIRQKFIEVHSMLLVI
ncbi:hypothetical protein EV368DRAFT_32205 [Lentinula lateritia]|nr:hypothetical protein EV368DRAFT_32205 [Lentinula lateritia]